MNVNTADNTQRTVSRPIVDFTTVIAATPVPAEDYDWRKDGLCAQTDPEAFFPEIGGSSVPAKRICNTCEVSEQCLAYALMNDEKFGIWGGLSPQERRRLLKKMAKQAEKQQAA